MAKYPFFSEKTGKALVNEQVKQTALLSVLANQEPRAALLADWEQAGSAVYSGLGAYVFPVASQFTETWKHMAASGGTETNYDNVFDVMHHGSGALVDGTTMPVMMAQMHYCLPFNTEFSPQQAFLYAIDGLPAGTYNVTMGFSWGSKVVSGKSYQFTLANALPAGGQLAGFYGAPDQAVSNWRVYAFASQTATTATETVTVSEGSDGTNLGTFTVAGAQVVPASGTPASYSSVTIDGTTYTYYGLNSLHRVAYGNNRWLHSAIRQYLNSSGFDWWEPQTVFDRPPSYKAYRGFMSGFSDDFLAVVQPIARKTALNYAVDGGTSAAPEYDTTYDYFVLPSGIEHNLADTAVFGGGEGEEGEQWDYWQRAAGSSSPLAWSSSDSSTWHPEYIQYDLGAQTTARYAWMRSAYRGHGNIVAFVTASGGCTTSYAFLGNRAAAACAISQSR